jgi:hypothetical protein
MPTPSVEANEKLLRQVGPGGTPIFVDPKRKPPIHFSRFIPTSDDADGLSLIRSRFRSEVWAAVRRERPDVRFHLARFLAETAIAIAEDVGLGALDFLPTEDALDQEFGEPWAHCVVQQLNRTEYAQNREAKKRIKEWAHRMAEGIPWNDVTGPFAEPSDQDAYRPS